MLYVIALYKSTFTYLLTYLQTTDRQTTDRQTTDRQTDGVRTTTYSEHEHEFRFANKPVKCVITTPTSYTQRTSAADNANFTLGLIARKFPELSLLFHNTFYVRQ